MEFDQATLRAAILATFERRGTRLPASYPLALTEAFSGDVSKAAQWQAFLRKNRLTANSLPEVIARLRVFLGPVLLPSFGTSIMKWAPVPGWVSLP